MKNLIILLLLLNTIIPAFSQPATVFKDRRINSLSDSREQYYVLKGDPSKKHGSYIEYFKGTKRFFIYKTGNYSFGREEGLWRYFYKHFPSDQLESQGYYKNGIKNGPWEFFYFNDFDSLRSDSSLTRQNELAKNEYTISFEIKGTLKYAGKLLGDKRIGTWDYYDRNSNLMMKINHTNDSVEFMDLTRIPSQDSSGVIRPFFCGGKEYLHIMTHQTTVRGIDKTGTVAYRLTVNKNMAGNSFRIICNTSNDRSAKSILKVLNTVSNEWIPEIRIGKVVDSEIDIIVTITSEHFNTNIMLRKHPELFVNTSGDFYHFKIDYQ